MLKPLIIIAMLGSCLLLSDDDLKISYDCLRSTGKPIERFCIQELKVTKPIDEETGAPLPDHTLSTINRVVCELDSGYRPSKKIFFYKSNTGYKWRYEGLLAYDSIKQMTSAEVTELIKTRFPVDSNQLGTFQTMPFHFKSGVWYEIGRTDKGNAGVYNVIFDSSNKAKVIYRNGPW